MIQLFTSVFITNFVFIQESTFIFLQKWSTQNYIFLIVNSSMSHCTFLDQLIQLTCVTIFINVEFNSQKWDSTLYICVPNWFNSNPKNYDQFCKIGPHKIAPFWLYILQQAIVLSYVAIKTSKVAIYCLWKTFLITWNYSHYTTF